MSQLFEALREGWAAITPNEFAMILVLGFWLAIALGIIVTCLALWAFGRFRRPPHPSAPESGRRGRRKRRRDLQPA